MLPDAALPNAPRAFPVKKGSFIDELIDCPVISSYRVISLNESVSRTEFLVVGTFPCPSCHLGAKSGLARCIPFHVRLLLFNLSIISEFIEYLVFYRPPLWHGTAPCRCSQSLIHFLAYDKVEKETRESEKDTKKRERNDSKKQGTVITPVGEKTLKRRRGCISAFPSSFWVLHPSCLPELYLVVVVLISQLLVFGFTLLHSTALITTAAHSTRCHCPTTTFDTSF